MATPAWAALEADLRRRIAAGELVDVFPGELSLAAEYSVSRHTVREALRRLRAEGLVVAARGRVSRVARPGEITHPLGAVYSLFAAVEAAGRHTASRELTREVVTDPATARRLRRGPGTRLFHLERLRLADGEPLAIDHVWLPATRVAAMHDADFEHSGYYDELAARCGIRLSGGTERIRAVVPTDEQRDRLGVGADVACLEVDRIGTVDGRPFEQRLTVIRGDRFTMTAAFSARDGYHLSS